jgi:predicted deacylase
MILPKPIKVDRLPDLSALPPASRHSFSLYVAHMADGADICLPVNVLVGASPGPRLLMVAGVHGNEYEGITAQLELWRELDPATLHGTLVMLPVANPPAFRAGQRRNPADEVDMNRVFPGDLQKSITHRLAYRIYHEILPGSDLLLSMHGWSSTGYITPYVEYPKDSPVTAQSCQAARIFGLGYLEAFDWIPGLLVEAASRAGVPAIEPEVGGANITMPERRSLYRRGVLNLMIHMGLLEGSLPGISEPKEVTRTEIFAPTGGVFLRNVEVGEQAQAGHRLASILDFHGHILEQIQAPKDGVVATIRLQAAVEPGDPLVVLFHPQS